MKAYQWIFFIISGLLFWQCSDEDTIVVDLPAYRRSYDTTSTDPVMQFISHYYYDYGKVFITDPDSSDYLYNFKTQNTVKMQMPKQDREHLLYGISRMGALFMNAYPADFIRKHFPLCLIISDSITSVSGMTPKEVDMFHSRNFMALNVGKKTKNYTFEENLHLSKSMHIAFLVEIFYRYGTGFDLTNFFAFGGAKYGMNTGSSDNPKRLDIKEIYKAGFLSDHAGWSTVTSTYPTKKEDLQDWMEFIFGYRADQWSKIPTNVEEMLETYPVIKQKYEALTQAFKTCIGVDYKDLIYKNK